MVAESPRQTEVSRLAIAEGNGNVNTVKVSEELHELLSIKVTI